MPFWPPKSAHFREVGITLKSSFSHIRIRFGCKPLNFPHPSTPMFVFPSHKPGWVDPRACRVSQGQTVTQILLPPIFLPCVHNLHFLNHLLVPNGHFSSSLRNLIPSRGKKGNICWGAGVGQWVRPLHPVSEFQFVPSTSASFQFPANAC